MNRGATRKVIEHIDRRGRYWVLRLKCRHVVYRRIRRRFTSGWQRGYKGDVPQEDPPPTWVYCEKCAELDK